MHPIIRQEEWFTPKEQWQGLLRIQMRGTTTAIDLADWVETTDRPRGMRKDRRSDLNRAQRTLRVTWALGDDQDAELSIDRFSTIYNLALDRLHSHDFHRFPHDYFSRLVALRDRLGIVFAWLDEELVGANIFLAGWDYAHGHLAGMNETGLKCGAGTLMIVEGAKWARQRGCKLLHLGGGLTPGDSLENFKLSFGGHSYRYAYLTFIADQEKFDRLREMPHAPWPYRMSET
jgi:CelD/BcsL family acetyltransferase involved in cellulose biosynthesis